MDKRKIRRIVSLLVAMSMMLSVVASAAEAAVATWLAPQPGQKIVTRNVEVAIGYNTHSDVRVTRLELWVDGKFDARKILVRPESRGVCSFWWDTARYSDGPHDLVVKVYSGDELLSKVSSTGTVGDYKYDLRPPTVSFTNVKSGDVLKGVTILKLSARDDSGEPPLVSLLVDKSLKLVQNRPPYDYDLDTTSYSDGDHELQTYAYDGAGNKSDPAVVQVAFKNGAEKPMVTSLNVTSHPHPEVYDESPTEALPVIPRSSVLPAAGNSAGRIKPIVSGFVGAAAPSAPVVSAPSAAAASIAVPKPRLSQTEKPVVAFKSASAAKPVILVEAKPVSKVAPALETAKVSIPAVSANPNKVVGLPDMAIRRGNIKPASGPALVRPVEPEQSLTSHVYMSPVLPITALGSVSAKILIPGATQASGSPAEPVGDAKVSGMPRMAMVPSAMLRTENVGAAFSNGAQAIEEALAAPMRSSVEQAAAPSPISRLRLERMTATAAETKGISVAPTTDLPVASSPKPVRMAAVPFVRDTNAQSASSRAIACPPPINKDTRAKLEKKTAPASGKMKLRDLYNNLSGILFWDAQTHTVTAISNNMKIELKIGSNVALVNGRKMQISETPYIIDGRTVIDVSIYHQASLFIASQAASM